MDKGSGNGRNALAAWVLVAINIAAIVWGAAKLDSSVSQVRDKVADVQTDLREINRTLKNQGDRLLILEQIPDHKRLLRGMP
jgi:hypothetical protein